jgi:transcriptional regulator with XRE-family HTH domain
MTTYGEVLAANARAARARLGIGQEQLATRMRALGYATWFRQTVSKAEKGERQILATEVIGLSYALETSVAALLVPTEDDKKIEFPSGRYLAATSVADSVRGRNDGSLGWDGDVPVCPPIHEGDVPMERIEAIFQRA